jgi:hypothetical protein
MQSTGHTSRQTSHPVQPDWLMTASSRGRFFLAGAAGLAGAAVCASAIVVSLMNASGDQLELMKFFRDIQAGTP